MEAVLIIHLHHFSEALCIWRKPLPWVSVHWLVQCTLECHWLTQCTVRYHSVTQQILAGYTGTPLEKLSWLCPTLEWHWRNHDYCNLHWNTTRETRTPPPPPHPPPPPTPPHPPPPPTPTHTHTRTRTHTQAYMIMQSSIHASLKWQDGRTPNGKWTGLCKYSVYLEFTAL